MTTLSLFQSGICYTFLLYFSKYWNLILEISIFFPRKVSIPLPANPPHVTTLCGLRLYGEVPGEGGREGGCCRPICISDRGIRLTPGPNLSSSIILKLSPSPISIPFSTALTISFYLHKFVTISLIISWYSLTQHLERFSYCETRFTHLCTFSSSSSSAVF